MNRIWLKSYPPGVPAEIDPAHREQLFAYAAALALVYPGRRIETWLVYTDGPVVMELALPSGPCQKEA